MRRWLRPGSQVAWDDGGRRRTGVVVEVPGDPWADRAVPVATPPTVPGRVLVAHIAVDGTDEHLWVPVSLLRRQRH